MLWINWLKLLTMFLLFMSSSIGFFLGMTRLVRPRCNAPKILLKMCKTSSDDLQFEMFINQLRVEADRNSNNQTITYLKWYELSTLSMWCMACCRWFAASCTCWSFHGESWLIDVRWTVLCALCTLKLMSWSSVEASEYANTWKKFTNQSKLKRSN